MNRSEILECAKRCVCGEREQDYGSPENNFALIAHLWTSYQRGIGITIERIAAKDVAAMMILLKPLVSQRDMRKTITTSISPDTLPAAARSRATNKQWSDVNCQTNHLSTRQYARSTSRTQTKASRVKA